MKFSAITIVIVLIAIVVCDAGVAGRAGYATYNGGNMGAKAGIRNTGSRFMFVNGGNNNEQQNLGAPAATLKPPAPQASGITTMGLIMIIMAVIILAFAGYWLIICYPFFNEDTLSYSPVTPPSVTTTRTNSGCNISPFPYLEDKKMEH